jgi:hypothetical protein
VKQLDDWLVEITTPPYRKGFGTQWTRFIPSAEPVYALIGFESGDFSFVRLAFVRLPMADQVLVRATLNAEAMCLRGVC